VCRRGFIQVAFVFSERESDDSATDRPTGTVCSAASNLPTFVLSAHATLQPPLQTTHVDRIQSVALHRISDARHSINSRILTRGCAAAILAQITPRRTTRKHVASRRIEHPVAGTCRYFIK